MAAVEALEREAPPGDIDLNAAMAAHPVRVLRLDASNLSTSSLSVGDLLDACEAAGIDPDELAARLGSGGARAGEAGLAVAWTIARRAYPDLTWAEVRANYRVEVVDTTPEDPPPGPGGDGPSTS